MKKSLTQTVRILKPSRVSTDERGRTVWDGPVEEMELELVSTTMLRQRADTPNEELSLVSTQALRKMLGQPARKEPGKKERKKDVLPGGGFDPYNNG